MGTASKILQPTEPRKKKGRRPKFREATFKDYEQIALLESRYGLGTLADKSYEKWIHLWQDRMRFLDHRLPGVPGKRSKSLCESVKALSRREGVTLFMTLLATFQTVLHRYTGQTDI